MSGFDALNMIDMAALLLDGKGYAVHAADVRKARAEAAEWLAELRASLALVYDMCETFDVPIPLIYTERVEALIAKSKAA